MRVFAKRPFSWVMNARGDICHAPAGWSGEVPDAVADAEILRGAASRLDGGKAPVQPAKDDDRRKTAGSKAKSAGGKTARGGGREKSAGDAPDDGLHPDIRAALNTLPAESWAGDGPTLEDIRKAFEAQGLDTDGLDEGQRLVWIAAWREAAPGLFDRAS